MLRIALKRNKLVAKFTGQRAEICLDSLQVRVAVDPGFATSEQIEIGPVN
jgi:hypothetical protein